MNDKTVRTVVSALSALMLIAAVLTAVVSVFLLWAHGKTAVVREIDVMAAGMGFIAASVLAGTASISLSNLINRR